MDLPICRVAWRPDFCISVMRPGRLTLEVSLRCKRTSLMSSTRPGDDSSGTACHCEHNVAPLLGRAADASCQADLVSQTRQLHGVRDKSQRVPHRRVVGGTLTRGRHDWPAVATRHQYSSSRASSARALEMRHAVSTRASAQGWRRDRAAQRWLRLSGSQTEPSRCPKAVRWPAPCRKTVPYCRTWGLSGWSAGTDC